VDSPPRKARSGRARRRAALRALVAAAIAGCALVAPLVPTAQDPRAAGSARNRVAAPNGGLTVDRGLRYARSPGAVLDVYRRRARRAARAPAVIVVHGGGWRFGDKRRMSAISRAFALRGFSAFNVNYTLAWWGVPGFPRQSRELGAAVRWVRHNAAHFSVDPARIGALGSSAGAHLAALHALSGPGPLGTGARVRAVAAWSGPFDLTRLERPALFPAVETFLGCGMAVCGRRVAAASPIEHVSPGDPPMLIVSSDDELVPLGQARAMAARLASARVPHALWVLPGARHGTEYTATALRPSIAFLRRRLR
jgi:acetyl esterase